jgi:hypothetical protein
MMPKHLLFCYAGSKWRLAKKYNRLYPRHRHFVDVFGGTGAVIARKPRSPVEIYNDLDNLAYNVFSVLQVRDRYTQLAELIENTPWSRRQYEVCRSILAAPETVDEIRRAWAFLVCGSVGFSGHHLRCRRQGDNGTADARLQRPVRGSRIAASSGDGCEYAPSPTARSAPIRPAPAHAARGSADY